VKLHQFKWFGDHVMLAILAVCQIIRGSNVSYVYLICQLGGPYGEKLFIFFSCSKLVLQITNGFVYATLVIESASVTSAIDL